MAKNCSFCHKELGHSGMVIHVECLVMLEEAHGRNMRIMEENYLLKQLVSVQGRELKRLLARLTEGLPLAS